MVLEVGTDVALNDSILDVVEYKSRVILLVVEHGMDVSLGSTREEDADNKRELVNVRKDEPQDNLRLLLGSTFVESIQDEDDLATDRTVGTEWIENEVVELSANVGIGGVCLILQGARNRSHEKAAIKESELMSKSWEDKLGVTKVVIVA